MQPDNPVQVSKNTFQLAVDEAFNMIVAQNGDEERAHEGTPCPEDGSCFSSNLVFAAKVAVIGAGTACYVLAGTAEAALLAATHAPGHT